MGNEEGKEKKDDFSIVIQDMLKLHQDCNFGLFDADDKILRELPFVLHGANFGDNIIRDMRAELFIEYSKAMIIELSKFAYDLTNDFAEIDETYSLINETNMEIAKLERSAPRYSDEEVKKSKENLSKIIEEYNRLVNKESELKSKGRKKFLINIFVPTAGFLTFFYIGLLTISKPQISGQGIISFWLLFLLLGGWVLKRFYGGGSIPEYIKEAIEENED